MRRPITGQLADEAATCLGEWKADASWKPLLDHAFTHLMRWPTLLGTPVIERLDIAADGGPLLEEGARALAIKAAAYVVAADLPATLPVPVPIEEAVYALTAQVDLLHGITARNGVRILQRTPASPPPYHPGCLTHTAYTAAWGEPPPRYWLSHDTVTTRQEHLMRLHAVSDLSPASHTITFTPGR